MRKRGFEADGVKEKPSVFSGQGLGKALPNKYLSVVEDGAQAESGSKKTAASLALKKRRLPLLYLLSILLILQKGLAKL